MRKIQFTVVATLFLLVCNACHKKKQSMEGSWIPYGYQSDLNTYVPWLKAHHYGNDHKYYGEWLNTAIKNTEELDWLDSENYLYLGKDTIPKTTYEIDSKGILLWKASHNFYYQRAQDTELRGTSIEKIKALLQNKYWSATDKTLYFESNGHMKLFENKSHLYKSYCWENKDFENYPILLRYGNHIDCNSYDQYPSQIVKLTETELHLNEFSSGDIKTVVYTAKMLSEEKQAPKAFQLCNTNIDIHNRFHRYYYTGTHYKGGLYKVRSFFKEHYQVPAYNKESGLIRIRFVVNCEGKAGMFECLELDNDYKEKQFSKSIREQILNNCKQLQEWIPGERDEKAIDTYRFLTFRIHNGEISEIFP